MLKYGIEHCPMMKSTDLCTILEPKIQLWDAVNSFLHAYLCEMTCFISFDYLCIEVLFVFSFLKNSTVSEYLLTIYKNMLDLYKNS